MAEEQNTSQNANLDAQQQTRQEEEEAALRERNLSELRRQLTLHHTRSPELQQQHQPNQPVRQSDQSPESGKNSKRRKVQWVGLGEDDHDNDNQAGPSTNHPGHVMLPMPSTPGDEPFAYFDAGSDGTPTPASGMTPNTSRPGTPDATMNIPIGERDGLPIASSSKRGRTFTKEAAKLVAVHKAKSMFRRPGQSRNNSAENSPTRARGVTSVSRTLYDDDIPSGAQRTPQGNGVLSALLKLYDQPQSAYSSSATLVASRSGSPSDRSPANELEQSRPASSGVSDGRQHVSNFFRGSSHAVAAASRDKVGVIGALQTSALNLTGAAQPGSGTLTPQRPAYKLSRHSLPEVPTHRSLSQSAPTSPTGSPLLSPATTPPLQKPSLYQRKTGSQLNLGSLGKLPGQVVDFNKDIAKKSEHLAREHLRADKYHHKSAVYKAKTSGSVPGTPAVEESPRESGYFDEKVNFGEKSKPVRRRKDKRRQDEIFITMHVAAILQRQDFILRLGRALMMFGAPSHRLEYQLQQTAKVLDIDIQVIYIVNFLIVSFTDPATHTSEIKFIKQTAGLDLGKLTDIAVLHWEVMHDKIGAEEASIEISNIMKAKPHYNNYWLVLFGAWASSMISIAAFNASFIDLLVIAPLGALLVAVQCFIAARSDILSSIFEIFIAAIISFTASALASTRMFCYASITSASIVLILPGWPVCVAALELQTRSIVSGSVRIVYAVVYSLFLGFGISLGANVWELVSNQAVYTANDGLCAGAHPLGAPWYQQTIGKWFFWLAVPGFPLGLALRNQARVNKELVVMVVIAGIGWNANHWSTYGFPGRSDISSALGALVVGLLGNIWGKFFQNTAFIVSCVPILFQLPSGLGNGGLLNFATTSNDSTAVFASGWSVAQQLLSVVIGLVVGLLLSCALCYPFGKRRGGLMTF